MMHDLDAELGALHSEIRPVIERLGELRRTLVQIDMPDRHRGGPAHRPFDGEPDDVTSVRRRVVMKEIEQLEGAVKAQERRMLEAARRHADQLERDPKSLDHLLDEIYREAGMRRPMMAAASIVLSEARHEGAVYPMGPGAVESAAADAARASDQAGDAALRGWAAGLEGRSRGGATAGAQPFRVTAAGGKEYPTRVRATAAGLFYG